MVSTILAGILVLIGLAVNAFFAGFGSALGGYILNKHIIKNLEKLKKRNKRK
jgi:hypothetical protein